MSEVNKEVAQEAPKKKLKRELLKKLRLKKE